jgi:hypothetical protein
VVFSTSQTVIWIRELMKYVSRSKHTTGSRWLMAPSNCSASH